jgi:hypothetical protein
MDTLSQVIVATFAIYGVFDVALSLYVLMTPSLRERALIAMGVFVAMR